MYKIKIRTLTIIYGTIGGFTSLMGGTVTSTPVTVDSTNDIVISPKGTITFNASSTQGNVTIDQTFSSFQNGTASYSGTGSTAVVDVTFSDAATGNNNTCTLFVSHTIPSLGGGGSTQCTNHQAFTFNVIAPKITFADVVRSGYTGAPNSISPSKTTNIMATVTPSLPSGSTTKIKVIVDNSGDTSAGSASVTTPSDGNITQSGNVTITGVTQTAPGGHQTKLFLEGQLNGDSTKLIGKAANGFSVAAFPTNFTTTIESPTYPNPAFLGFTVKMTWSSDSGHNSDLDQVTINESTGPAGTNIPPFDGTLVGGNPTDVNANGAGDSFVDGHGFQKSDFATLSLGSGSGKISQIYTFSDTRTGASTIAVPNAGFLITHNLAISNSGRQKHVHYSGTKTGSDTVIGPATSKAGSGNASSATIDYNQ